MVIVMPSLTPSQKSQNRIVFTVIFGLEVPVSKKVPHGINGASAVPKNGGREKPAIDKSKRIQEKQKRAVSQIDSGIVTVNKFVKRIFEFMAHQPDFRAMQQTHKLHSPPSFMDGSVGILRRIGFLMMFSVNGAPGKRASGQANNSGERPENFKPSGSRPGSMGQEPVIGHAHPDTAREKINNEGDQIMPAVGPKNHGNNGQVSRNLSQKQKHSQNTRLFERICG